MAWIIGDSFDFYAAVADAAGLWTTITAGTISSTTRFGVGRSYQFGNIAVGLEKSFGSNEATVFCATAFLCAAGSTGSTIVAAILLQDGATTQCSVCFERPGNLVLRSGGITGSVLATYANAFQQTVWDHFQIKVVIHNTTGSITVRRNGDAADTWTATGLNTRGGTANNSASAVRLRSDNAVTSAWFDDFLCFSGSGAAPNDWVGDIRAVQLLPSADTAQRDFSRSTGATNFALVDEAVQNGDADYVFSATPSHQDLYDLGDLATTPASILAVQARMFAKKTDSGARSGQIRVKSGATEAGSADTVLSTSYAWLSRVDVTDPNTGAGWTAAAVNALGRARVRTRSMCSLPRIAERVIVRVIDAYSPRPTYFVGCSGKPLCPEIGDETHRRFRGVHSAFGRSCTADACHGERLRQRQRGNRRRACALLLRSQVLRPVGAAGVRCRPPPQF